MNTKKLCVEINFVNWNGLIYECSLLFFLTLTGSQELKVGETEEILINDVL